MAYERKIAIVANQVTEAVESHSSENQSGETQEEATDRIQILDKFDYTHGASLTFTFDAAPGKVYYFQVAPWETRGGYQFSVK